MDYTAIERYLDSFVNYEVIPGFGFASEGYNLDHVHEVLRRLGNPHIGPRTVHVAGSKGKGSVAAMTASALSACGYRTGLYTSPHLLHLGERIRVDGVCVSPGELLAALETARPHLDSMRADSRWRQFTYFEILTVLCFLHFRSMNVDVQVVEVGLGGRLDTTNVVKPDVCAITPISLEHTAVLGNTIGKIAAEKAGIIKPGALVVSAPQLPEADAVICAVCRDRDVRLVRVGVEVSWVVSGSDLAGQDVAVSGPWGETLCHIPLAGLFQSENATVAVTALHALSESGVRLDERCIERGLGAVEWQGRFQVLSRHPLVVVDGAHNAASMRRVAQSMDAIRPRRCVVFVLGFSSDKDMVGSVAELGWLGARFVLTASSQPRAARPSDVAMRLTGLGLDVRVEPEPMEAIYRARQMAGEEGIVCVAGSLYLVADVLRLWNDWQPSIR
ncbi:MAG: bifunctional folylpolyglutamate synthase/dihydrofolate synthase [Dehalococcoidia bacterium]|nr:bifunctional folylpolyglutamate synthase/dihydrofolate synthase [Dehalococcoidia bacterium]